MTNMLSQIANVDANITAIADAARERSAEVKQISVAVNAMDHATQQMRQWPKSAGPAGSATENADGSVPNHVRRRYLISSTYLLLGCLNRQGL
ncbi:hypothetical protein [Rhizobium halophilum]|uniref:hypothetical protein n=1 Tax=Rhizobium halophilum TaxID=2846852 RepID=UPI001EFC4B43|nr:hypothetical protein [Rhizobium halophilum]MCF6370526.1 hypothetical protein [Rhizobium halophilum]